MSYSRAYPAWYDWPNISTPFTAAVAEQWDQAIYDLKTSGGGGASGSRPTKAITATGTPTQYTATTSDSVLLCDATAGRVEITLPAASGCKGQLYTLRKTDSTSHNVFMCPAGTETLDGAAAGVSQGRNVLVALTTQWQAITVVSDGTNWQRLQIGDTWAHTPATAFVDANNGSDSNSGLLPWFPKKTIAGGLAVVGRGTLYVAAGTYVETVDLSGKDGVRIIGPGYPDDNTATAGAVIRAPSATASAVQVSGGAMVELSYFTLTGNSDINTPSGSINYTGTILDATNAYSGSHFHHLNIVGVPGDENGAKVAVGPGVYGGTGILSNNNDGNVVFEHIGINYCHLGLQMTGTTTESQVSFRMLMFGDNFLDYQENPGGGGCIMEQWKGQNAFAMTFAIAVLTSDGTNPADGDTVTVRDRTYRFKNTMGSANDVKIGATWDATMLSLVHAVNQTGTVGTDYFTGTTAPTGVQAGKMNLVDHGGGNGFTYDQIDTTNKQCVFQVTDTVGPAGNAYTATTTSAHLSFPKTTFDRAGWAVEIHSGGNTWIQVDMTENISLPVGNCWLVASNNSNFIDCKSGPQTKVSVTGNYNTFNRFDSQNTFTIEAGAEGNEFFDPTSGDESFPSNYVDKGTNTRWIGLPSGRVSNPANGTVDVASAVNPRDSYGPPVPRASGIWYPTPVGPLTPFTLVAGRTYFLPLYISELGNVISDLRVHVATGAASSTVYAGVFFAEGSGGLPGTYWSGFTNMGLDSSVTGDLSFGTPSNGNRFYRSMFWLGFGALGGTPAVLGVASGSAPTPLVGSATLSDLTGGGGQCYYQDGILSGGTFSNASSLSVGAGTPALFYKFS